MIVLQSPVCFGALLLTRYEQERSQTADLWLAHAQLSYLHRLPLTGHVTHVTSRVHVPGPPAFQRATLKRWEWAWGQGYMLVVYRLEAIMPA